MLRTKSLSLLLLVALSCGEDEPDEPGGATAGTIAGAMAGAAGGAMTGSQINANSGAGAGSAAGAGSSGMWPQLGVCGVRSEGIVTATSFETYEERYLLGDEGFGDTLCAVRFDVRRVGDAPPNCGAFAGQQESCQWTHLVEYSNPVVVTNDNGACERSELALNQAAIDAIVGRQVAYGYVGEYQGHNNVLLRYDAERAVWDADANAAWAEATGDFQFDRRDGFCGYAGPAMASAGTGGTSGTAGSGGGALGGASTAAGTGASGDAGASGANMMPGTVVADDYVEDIAIAVHDDVSTVLVVTWNQARAAERTWLEFSFEGGEPMRSRGAGGEVGSHRDVVLGVPAETEITVQVVSEQAGVTTKSTPRMATTGPLPSSMPLPTVLSYDPERASPKRYLFGAVENSGNNVANNLNSYLTYQAWIYIMDRQGRIVWYYNDPSRDSPSGFPRVARDGEYIWMEESRVGRRGRVIKMTLDREYYEVIDIPGLADSIDVTDDGSLLYDVGTRGELREMTRDGQERTIWTCADELALSQCYSNAINWNPIEDSVLMSFPYPAVVAEIDRQSGELIGYYGHLPGTWDFAPPLDMPPSEWRFGFQHFPNITPDGTLLVSSHMPDYYEFETPPTPHQHAFVEFAIDRDNQILTEVWRYTGGTEWPRARGMAIRLDNGNTLGNYGTAGVIREITPDKETVFHVKFDIPRGDDNYNKLVGHNVLIDDLYALNGGGPE